MNEYRDQVVWFEFQVFRSGEWVTVSDHDTREQAESAKEFVGLDVTCRVRRVSGLEG